jgi:hypothetical protein
MANRSEVAAGLPVLTVLEYPSHNRLGVPLEYVRRRVEIIEERNVASEPISLQSFLQRPFLRRGATLLTAIEDGKRRKFYRECCKGGQDAGLQFVLVDDDDPQEQHKIGRVFAPTVEDRQRMLDVYDSLGALPFGFTLCVRAVQPVAHGVHCQ